ncbi:MAG TPA: hypothetical protein V6C97_23010 [Oculatellaceae cyanobacterium]
MQRVPQKSSSPMPLLIGLGVILAIGAIIYGVMAFQKAYTVDPKQVFEEYFTNQPDRVQNLTGGGQLGGYFDIWIYFESPDIIRLRSPEWSRDQENVHRIATWWSLNHPAQSEFVNDLGNIQAWKMYRHPDTVEIFNAEYLVHTKKNLYWLRIWGRK